MYYSCQLFITVLSVKRLRVYHNQHIVIFALVITYLAVSSRPLLQASDTITYTSHLAEH
uniref:Uncharacterized protein n=1 Tax=Anguilla anguilla TaxID=7936 RepID=A0A0E9WLZ5_ANGAN